MSNTPYRNLLCIHVGLIIPLEFNTLVCRLLALKQLLNSLLSTIWAAS